MIDVAHVTKTFGSGRRATRVLDDVSIAIPPTAIAGIVGTSGAGKTTLLRCVNLLERPDAGSITVDGRELTSLRRRDVVDIRRSIGMVFQSSSLLAHRSAAGNAAFPLEVAGVHRRESRRRVAELLERVGLSDRAHAHPSQLSGGERQRVGIARALALRPKILLADEPTSGLDPDTTGSILRLLRTLRDDLGLTILLITHEMDVVRVTCDQTTLLEDGRIVESGATVDLLADASSTLGRRLIARRDAAAAGPGQVAFEVLYGSRVNTTAWITGLADAIGDDVHLLAASIEEVRGALRGTATIAVADAHAADAASWLQDHDLLRAAPSAAPDIGVGG